MACLTQSHKKFARSQILWPQRLKDDASPPCPIPKKHDIQCIMNSVAVTLLKNSKYVFFQIWRGPQKEVMGHQIWQTWRSGYWTWSATYLVMMENSALLELENNIKNFQDCLITSTLWCTQWQVSWHYTGSSYLIWCPTPLFFVQLYMSQSANYRISRSIRRSFFPEKYDLNSTCVLCAKDKYYFQTYKYL